MLRKYFFEAMELYKDGWRINDKYTGKIYKFERNFDGGNGGFMYNFINLNVFKELEQIQNKYQ